MKRAWHDNRDVPSAKYISHYSRIFIMVNSTGQENQAWTPKKENYFVTDKLPTYKSCPKDFPLQYFFFI